MLMQRWWNNRLISINKLIMEASNVTMINPTELKRFARIKYNARTTINIEIIIFWSRSFEI